MGLNTVILRCGRSSSFWYILILELRPKPLQFFLIAEKTEVTLIFSIINNLRKAGNIFMIIYFSMAAVVVFSIFHKNFPVHKVENKIRICVTPAINNKINKKSNSFRSTLCIWKSRVFIISKNKSSYQEFYSFCYIRSSIMWWNITYSGT